MQGLPHESPPVTGGFSVPMARRCRCLISLKLFSETRQRSAMVRACSGLFHPHLSPPDDMRRLKAWAAPG